VHLNRQGYVVSYQKYFYPESTPTKYFGYSVANVGDINGDGFADIAVGAPGDNNAEGAVVIFFLGNNCTILSHKTLSSQTSPILFTPPPSSFGTSIYGLGDFNNDGIPDIAVGAPNLYTYGMVVLLFMNVDGSIKNCTKIKNPISMVSDFGSSIAAARINSDSTVDLFIGDELGGEFGRVYAVMMGPHGHPLSIETTYRPKVLSQGALFGSAVGVLPNLADDDGSSLSVLVAARGYQGGSIFIGQVDEEDED